MDQQVTLLHTRLRQALPQDLDGIWKLSSQLNTVNLPYEPQALEEALLLSKRSFSGEILDPTQRTYVFVLENKHSGQIMGTSQIVAKHGSESLPHLFFEVCDVEHYARTIDTRFCHRTLQLKANSSGLTELGGLVLGREYRKNNAHFGRQLSFVRFLWIGLFPQLFEKRLLAELLPPLLPNGESPLWEALGKRFTGLDYAKADRISRSNKEFILSLFPKTPIYTSLLNEQAQSVIGVVGKQSLAAGHLLESIGFSYRNRVDPFDGGPHFEADQTEVSLFERLHRDEIAVANDLDWLEGKGMTYLVGHVQNAFQGGNRFFVMQTKGVRQEGRLYVLKDALEALELHIGERPIACLLD